MVFPGYWIHFCTLLWKQSKNNSACVEDGVLLEIIITGLLCYVHIKNLAFDSCKHSVEQINVQWCFNTTFFYVILMEWHLQARDCRKSENNASNYLSIKDVAQNFHHHEKISTSLLQPASSLMNTFYCKHRRRPRCTLCLYLRLI